MQPEAFEQLVSQWLDEPQDAELHARIDAAAADSVELARLRDEWTRLDRLIRAARPTGLTVAWSRQKQRVMRELAEAAEPDAMLDATLAALPGTAGRVDWQMYQRRVMDAVRTAGRPRRAVRVRWGYALSRAGAVAAAAVLVLMFSLPFGRHPGLKGVALVQVSPSAIRIAHSTHSLAMGRVLELDESETGPAEVAEPRLAEVFLMVGPVQPAGTTMGAAEPFAF
ncbi:MAG: hypothetical protein KKB50_09560 [Planctomycetes bacterium]|nr:hypothetical protein [Planctomycetota bacterium]